MAQAFLLLGTNFGALKENLLKALEELENNGIKVLKKSKIYQTRAWGKTDQPDFLNIAVKVRCDHSAQELLKKIKQIESKLERTNSVKWGPRSIDIDILFYEKEIINEPDLIIPHPYFFERPFAIIPMAEIAPYYIPPKSSKTILELRNGVSNEGIEIYRD